MKTFVITDPCYIIDDKTWSEICNTCKSLCDEDYTIVFNTLIGAELKKITGSKLVSVAETGYGDWSNRITTYAQTHVNLVNDAFAADSGMVCVCEETNEVDDRLIQQPGYGVRVASFRTDETNIKIVMDTSDKNWTEVKIVTLDTNETILSTSPAKDSPVDEDY